MRREVPYLVCDVCSVDELGDPAAGIKTHRIAFDGVAMEAEVCKRCTDDLLVGFARFATVGRRVPIRTRIADAVPFPGTAWQFSAHALTRLGERHIDPLLAIAAADDPQVTRPGRASDLEVRQRGKVKAVVAPARGVIVTVGGAEDEDM
jgi:hypothetical protein